MFSTAVVVAVVAGVTVTESVHWDSVSSFFSLPISTLLEHFLLCVVPGFGSDSLFSNSAVKLSSFSSSSFLRLSVKGDSFDNFEVCVLSNCWQYRCQQKMSARRLKGKRKRDSAIWQWWSGLLDVLLLTIPLLRQTDRQTHKRVPISDYGGASSWFFPAAASTEKLIFYLAFFRATLETLHYKQFSVYICQFCLAAQCVKLCVFQGRCVASRPSLKRDSFCWHFLPRS